MQEEMRKNKKKGVKTDAKSKIKRAGKGRKGVGDNNRDIYDLKSTPP